MKFRLGSVTLLGAALVAAQDSPLVVPAYGAYAAPDVHGMRRDEHGGVTRWTKALNWYGDFPAPGGLRVGLRLLPDRVARSAASRLILECAPTVGGEVLRVRADCAADATEVVFPEFTLRVTGYHRLTLTAESGPRPPLASLALDGVAARGARFGTVERRNAASVHLGWQVPAPIRDEVEWFYCEVTPREDPLWTYYMATGWHRGYFGIQVNSPTERRVIFSVWDAGNEGVDRDKVRAEDRVQLVAKGDDVVAEGFGNEGTGGHSHLVHDWKTGDTCRFAVHAEPDGDHTTYTGWFWMAEPGHWERIASFRAPRDGGFLRGLYSFNENFAGENGDRLRRCEFGNAWVRNPAGEWVALRSARFTHDGHGRSERLDRSAGVIGERFWLQNGGYVEDRSEGAVTRAGSELALPERADQEPPRDLPLRVR